MGEETEAAAGPPVEPDSQAEPDLLKIGQNLFDQPLYQPLVATMLDELAAEIAQAAQKGVNNDEDLEKVAGKVITQIALISKEVTARSNPDWGTRSVIGSLTKYNRCELPDNEIDTLVGMIMNKVSEQHRPTGLTKPQMQKAMQLVLTYQAEKPAWLAYTAFMSRGPGDYLIFPGYDDTRIYSKNGQPNMNIAESTFAESPDRLWTYEAWLAYYSPPQNDPWLGLGVELMRAAGAEDAMPNMPADTKGRANRYWRNHGNLRNDAD